MSKGQASMRSRDEIKEWWCRINPHSHSSEGKLSVIGKGRHQKKVQRDSFSLVAFSGLRRHFAAQPTMEPSYPSHIALRGLMVQQGKQDWRSSSIGNRNPFGAACMYKSIIPTTCAPICSTPWRLSPPMMHTGGPR